MTTRKDIINHVVELLCGALGDTVSVYASRVRHLQCDELPSAGVYALKEQIEHNDTSPRRYERALTLVVEIVATASRNLDAVLYALTDKVEDALMEDSSFNQLVEDSEITSLSISLAESGERLMGCARLECTVTYERLLPEKPLDIFSVAGVAWDIAPADGKPEAHDSIDMPEEPIRA